MVASLLVVVRLAVLVAAVHTQEQAQQIMVELLLQQDKATQVVITVRARHLHQQVAVELVQSAVLQLAILQAQVAQDWLLQ